MAAAAAASGSEQAAAPEPTAPPAPACPRATLDPQLFMAARRGDSKLLKHLLQLQDEDEEEDANAMRKGGLILEANNGGVRTNNEGDLLLQVVDSEMDVLDDDRRSPSPSPASHDDDAPPQPPPPVDEPLDAGGVTMEGDSLLHVVAAARGGDTHRFLDCAKMIVRDKKRRKGGAAAVRLALEARNSKGDTPLHCAAAAGNDGMIKCLVDLMASDGNDRGEDADAAAELKKGFVKMQNDCGETALHHAVRAPPHTNTDTACIDELMKIDPDLACVLHKDGTSPLYVAISLGKHKIAEHLYSKSQGKLSYSGPDGRNVLHAAVPRGQAILGWLIEKVKKQAREDGATTACTCTLEVSSGPGTRLLTQLTSQRDKKQKGSTPLHLAASLSGWPSAWFLCRRFPQVWPTGESMAKLLLDANESTAYQADNDQGWYPIHVAAHAGSVGVLKLLLERCPDCATLRDAQGRTFLHVATENSRYYVVRYVQDRIDAGEIMPPHPLFLHLSSVLNAQDSSGNTALHGAVRAGNLAVFNCLFRNPQVRLDVANQDGMTPLDLSWTKIPAGYNYGFNTRNVVRSSLLAAGAPHGGGDRPELFYEKHMPKRDVDKESKKYTEATQVMSIVAVLIVTVTFASAFTFPGGYRDDDGQPVLAGSYAFDAFILADTLAFICSITATCTLVYAGFPAVHISIRSWYTNVSMGLLLGAARSLVAAFGLGLYLVFHHTASTIAACAIVFASSFYGHMEVRRIIRMATTVGARIASRRRYALSIVSNVFFVLLVHFWPYVIIFGLPAIRKKL